ncbi:hypothetical protein R3P38DRAFT_3296645 [Favolaschia claudopus]|uniref:Uncharacterized protein n=1 Tax=Favolaschia claudopus TaxID=2862362 RepID=A0AAV9Z8H5_9AGAR
MPINSKPTPQPTPSIDVDDGFELGWEGSHEGGNEMTVVDLSANTYGLEAHSGDTRLPRIPDTGRDNESVAHAYQRPGRRKTRSVVVMSLSPASFIRRTKTHPRSDRIVHDPVPRALGISSSSSTLVLPFFLAVPILILCCVVLAHHHLHTPHPLSAQDRLPSPHIKDSRTLRRGLYPRRALTEEPVRTSLPLASYLHASSLHDTDNQTLGSLTDNWAEGPLPRHLEGGDTVKAMARRTVWRRYCQCFGKMTALRAEDPATTRICDGGNGDEGEDRRGSLFRHAQEEGGERGEGVEDGVEVRSARRTSSVNTTAPRRAQIVARGIMEECTASACYTSIQLQADADEPLPLAHSQSERAGEGSQKESTKLSASRKLERRLQSTWRSPPPIQHSAAYPRDTDVQTYPRSDQSPSDARYPVVRVRAPSSSYSALSSFPFRPPSHSPLRPPPHPPPSTPIPSVDPTPASSTRATRAVTEQRRGGGGSIRYQAHTRYINPHLHPSYVLRAGIGGREDKPKPGTHFPGRVLTTMRRCEGNPLRVQTGGWTRALTCVSIPCMQQASIITGGYVEEESPRMFAAVDGGSAKWRVEGCGTGVPPQATAAMF